MFYVCVLQLLFSFQAPLIEKVLRMVVLFSQTRIVLDRHFVHCTSEFYKLGGPTGSEQIQLNGKIMSQHAGIPHLFSSSHRALLNST